MNTSTQQLYDRCKANPYMANDAEFMEALRQMVKDAERYRWIRELPNADSLNVTYCGIDLDNVIDAEIGDTAK